MFGQMADWMAGLPVRTNPILAGDMNGRTGFIQNGPSRKLVSCVSAAIGSFSPEDENEQGCCMRTMLETFNMVAVNTLLYQGAKTFYDKGKPVSRVDQPIGVRHDVTTI